MLTDEEWQRVSPLLTDMVAAIKQYRQEHACGIAEATATTAGVGARALAVYEDLTGFRETNVNALFHHRLSLYGPPCGKCGKPLRTPQARYCAMCDWVRPPLQSAPMGAGDAAA